VQDIKYATFNNCISLERITIPSTVTEIDQYAISYCPNLRDVVLHDGIKRIMSDAFHGCSSLERITIPSTVTRIGADAFINCSSLREVVIHNEGVQIKSNAFRECSSLERFKFPRLFNRLDNIIQAGQTDIEAKMDSIPAVEWRGGELVIPAVLRENWNRLGIRYTVAEIDKEKLNSVEGLITYYEMKEASTLFELALWKARIDDADISNTTNREACRVEVPGPVKDTLMHYLYPAALILDWRQENSSNTTAF